MRIAALLLLLPLLGTSGTATAADTLSVVLDWLPNPDEAPLFVAKHEGFFNRHGLDVNLIAPSDAATPPMLAAVGRVDVAISYQPQLYMLVAQGVPLMRFGSLVSQPLDSIIVLSKGPVRRLADMRGRKLGYAVGGVEEVLARTMLASAGLKPQDVQLVNVNFQIVSALLGHSVDGTISAYRNKEIHEVAVHGAQAVSFFPEDYGVPAYDELIYVTRKSAIHDGRLPRFVAAVRDATAWLREHPEQAWKDFAADYPAEDTPLVHTEWLATLPYFAKNPGELDIPRYQRFGTFMQARGLIGTAPAVEAIAVNTETAQ